MTNLKNINIMQLLPFNMRDDDEVEALGYAIQVVVNQICDFSEKINATVNLDNASNELLNSLCLEFNIPCYHENDSRQIKKNLIKEAFLWHSIAGTPEAMLKYFATIGLDAQIQEWHTYNGSPYHFRIIANAKENQDITDEIINDIEKQVKKLKNARSILDETVIIKPKLLDVTEAYAFGLAMLSEKNINAEYDKELFDAELLTDANNEILIDENSDFLSL